jgi:hypothetical protein
MLEAELEEFGLNVKYLGAGATASQRSQRLVCLEHWIELLINYLSPECEGSASLDCCGGIGTQARVAEGERLRAIAAGAECRLISQEGCMTSLAQSQETFLLPRHQAQPQPFSVGLHVPPNLTRKNINRECI